MRLSFDASNAQDLVRQLTEFLEEFHGEYLQEAPPDGTSPAPGSFIKYNHNEGKPIAPADLHFNKDTVSAAAPVASSEPPKTSKKGPGRPKKSEQTEKPVVVVEPPTPVAVEPPPAQAPVVASAAEKAVTLEMCQSLLPQLHEKFGKDLGKTMEFLKTFGVRALRELDAKRYHEFHEKAVEELLK